MKVAVCVKHVPDGRVRLDPGSTRLDRSGSGDLNAMDLYALEEALRVKGDTDGEVVAVSMGPPAAAESLRSALALGADRAVLVSDPQLAGADLVTTSTVLAAVLEREQPDLVLFGQQSADGAGALLWAAVAEHLRRPAISQATALTLDDGTARVTRQSELGDEVVETSLPAVVAVTDAINEPRYASLRGMMAAKRKPLEQLSAADLGIDTGAGPDGGSQTEVLALGAPPGRPDAIRVDDETKAAQVIADFLAERGLL
jgi:electron transfer flavoprotein beta subunit